MYNVLLVDDDKVVRYSLRKMNLWEKHGFAISDEAGNGYEALNKLSLSHFDMAFVDIKMPKINGIEFLKEIKENSPNLCVVLMSGFSDFTYTRQGIILGAFDYILKPVKEEDLHDVLSRANTYLDNKKNKDKLKSKLSEIIDVNLGVSAFALEKDSIIKKFHLDHGNSVIRRLCQFVLLHSDEKISLESVSAELCFSSTYLSKLFKQNTGEGFNEYVTKVKMERAKALLQTGKYKNYEVSDMLCYGKADYFSSLFKRYTGVTPVEYRQSTSSDRKCK
jgi:two-component system response regulator YesN